MDDRWHDAITDLIRRSQLCQSDELGAALSAAVGPLELDVAVYLVDLEQRELRPLPDRGKPLLEPPPEPLPIDATVAGRVFSEIRARASGGAGGEPARLWVPLIDGTDRLGVVAVRPAGHQDLADAAFRERCELLVGLLGHLIASKLPYGDLLHRVRRTRPMSPAAELLVALLPPLTFSSDRLVVAAVLEPCYTVGGDAFDYAVDGSVARLLVLDAMGRGLDAALTAATALAAIRGARRDGHGLYAMARAADETIRGQFGNAKFATAVLAELDLDTGMLRYLNAGHPPPLVLRRGKAVRFLDGGRRLPLGMDDAAIEVAQERLEPGDGLLLYTDGITEARAPDGEQFGVERLVDLAERHAVEGLAAPEKLRRLAHSVLAHQHGPAGDDATLMLLEWSKVAASRTASMAAVRREL